MSRYLVDGNNVVGSKPDGWWRDRRGATQRLIAALSAWAREQPDRVTVVFDGTAVATGSGEAPNLEVAFAGPGRSADDEIAQRAAHDPDPTTLVVVTSDAGLARRLPPAATVVGAGAFRRRLET